MIAKRSQKTNIAQDSHTRAKTIMDTTTAGANIAPKNNARHDCVSHHHRWHHQFLGGAQMEIVTAATLLGLLANCLTIVTSAATLSDSNANQQQPVGGGHQFLMTPDIWAHQSTNSNTNSPSTNSKNESPKLQMSLTPPIMLQPHCNLGNDTYQLGERWNPNLPPFGVQVCVQCECIVRQRKSCYEAKVTCRRITNECPIIDSCPDGKRPVTIAGQCCKSCQSTNTFVDGGGSGAPWAQAEPVTMIPVTTTLAPTTNIVPLIDRQFNYKNERVKEYQAMIKTLPACQRRGENGDKHQMTIGGIKSTKNNKPNDLNGIDSRLAFKSLDPQSSYVSPVKGSRDYQDKALDDTMRHDHQHPNDVQSGAGSQQNYESTRFVPFQHQQQSTTTRKPQLMNTPPLANICTLGSETYQIGEKWNPILPPHGIQACVQCNCIVRQRKLCYEAKVTCRRINNDCPNIDECPDGQKPVTVVGQCCKSCQNNDQNVGVITTVHPERMQKNDRILREYQTIMRNYPACSRLRDGERLNGGGGGGSGNNTVANSTVTVKRSYNK